MIEFWAMAIAWNRTLGKHETTMQALTAYSDLNKLNTGWSLTNTYWCPYFSSKDPNNKGIACRVR